LGVARLSTRQTRLPFKKELAMSPIRSIALILALTMPAAQTLAADTVGGHYRMGDQRFELKHGVAIRLWQDAERETFGVVLGEGPLDATAASGALDPLDAIASSAPADSGTLLMTLVRDEQSLQIGSLIARPDSFSTNGDGNERVSIEAERLRGQWTKPETEFFDKTYEMGLSFDLPLAVFSDPGQPLPADGGEPGKAYLAFIDVLRKRDTKAIIAKQALAADMVEILGEDSIVEIATMAHPETAEVVGGWIDGERAQLRIKGRHAYGQTVRGRVEMKNDGGVWKVGDNALR